MWPVALCPSLECILRKEKYGMPPLTSTGGEEMHSYDRYFWKPSLPLLSVCYLKLNVCYLYPETAQRR